MSSAIYEYYSETRLSNPNNVAAAPQAAHGSKSLLVSGFGEANVRMCYLGPWQTLPRLSNDACIPGCALSMPNSCLAWQFFEKAEVGHSCKIQVCDFLWFIQRVPPKLIKNGQFELWLFS